MSNEFDLIARIRARCQSRDPALQVGIGDDAAVFRPEPGQNLVTTTDSLVIDRHFGADWPAADIGHLALAVNLSDLAAMAASPRWALLALTLPRADEAWLDGFLDGFLGLAERTGTSLIGGNIASGPLNIGVQLIGQVDPSRVVRRSGVRPDQLILLTGTLGDAAAALTLGDSAPTDLLRRLRRPEPRLAAGVALGGWARAMIDVSDGLLADLGHLLGADLGAELDLSAIPASPALMAAFPDPVQRWPLQLSGGNDYELLFTVAPEQLSECRQSLHEVGLAVSIVGRVTTRAGVQCIKPDGGRMVTDRYGWDHFGD